MFSNTAYEALYQLLGLELHAKFIELITGEAFFKGIILIIFGALFFITLIKFISRYVPGSIIDRRHVPLSKFLKIIVCLFLGLTILRVGTKTGVTDYSGKNWSTNPYVQGRFDNVQAEYRVSIVFSLISQTAEEITALLSRTIDKLFAKGNSQLGAPNLFYKAIMYAGITTIEDKDLKDQLQFYSEECFAKVIPSIDGYKKNTQDNFFNKSSQIDEELRSLPLELGNGKVTDCYQVKESTVSQLMDYGREKSRGFQPVLPYLGLAYGGTPDKYFTNYVVSMGLVNYYSDKHEDRLGIQRGSEAPGAAGGFFQNISRVLGWDGLLGLTGNSEAIGASEAASRAKEFSEHLARAPHVAGFVRMCLIAIFPWLIFFVVAGNWRVLLVWFWIYFSVLLWTPIWTLLYHIMLGITMSAEMMESFGQLVDSVSLYSASIVNHRLYYMFSIYSWVQLLVASLTTGSVFLFIKPMLGHSTQESLPEGLGTSYDLAGKGVDVMRAKDAVGVAAAVL